MAELGILGCVADGAVDGVQHSPNAKVSTGCPIILVQLVFINLYEQISHSISLYLSIYLYLSLSISISLFLSLSISISFIVTNTSILFEKFLVLQYTTAGKFSVLFSCSQVLDFM